MSDLIFLTFIVFLTLPYSSRDDCDRLHLYHYRYFISPWHWVLLYSLGLLHYCPPGSFYCVTTFYCDYCFCTAYIQCHRALVAHPTFYCAGRRPILTTPTPTHNTLNITMVNSRVFISPSSSVSRAWILYRWCNTHNLIDIRNDHPFSPLLIIRTKTSPSLNSNAFPLSASHRSTSLSCC